MKTRLSTKTSLIHVLISIVVVGLLFSVNLTMANQSSVDLNEEEISTGMEVDAPARVLRAFPPQYPYDALENHIEGRVLVQFVVDTDGDVQEPEILEADPEGFFEQSSLDAIMLYKFEPAVKDGMPVNSFATLPMVYELDNDQMLPESVPSDLP